MVVQFEGRPKQSTLNSSLALELTRLPVDNNIDEAYFAVAEITEDRTCSYKSVFAEWNEPVSLASNFKSDIWCKL